MNIAPQQGQDYTRAPDQYINPWHVPEPPLPKETPPVQEPHAVETRPIPQATAPTPVTYFNYPPIYPREALTTHPNAETTLWLGILGCIIPLFSFGAWWVGSNARREEHEGNYRSSAYTEIGWVLGIFTSLLQITAISLILLFYGFILYTYGI